MRAPFVTRRLIRVCIVLGLHTVVFVSLSVISLVLIGAYFQTVFIISYSASDICGKGFMAVPPSSYGRNMYCVIL